jgi:hypothetical protein
LDWPQTGIGKRQGEEGEYLLAWKVAMFFAGRNYAGSNPRVQWIFNSSLRGAALGSRTAIELLLALRSSEIDPFSRHWAVRTTHQTRKLE